MRDPYEILGVPKTASLDEIKKAHRKLVKELHPDVNPGDKIVEQHFKEVNAAYELLSDSGKRARYDRGEIDPEGKERPDYAFRRAWRSGSKGGGRPFGGFGADIFEDLFGRGGFRAKGADVSYTLSVGFVDAALGGRQRLRLSDGRDLELTIPSGTTDRETLRLKGQGLEGMGGGEPGDAYVEIRVEPHAHFRLDGRDIHLDLPVTLHEAVLGASIEVPTIAGAVKLKIAPGSNTGSTLRLQGRGIPARGSSPRGHQFVHLQVVLPDAADPELADFVRRWQPAADYAPRRKAGLE